MTINQQRAHRILMVFIDIIEKHLPALIFALMFVSFIVQIVYRYFIYPLTWPLEFSLFSYIWIIVFGTIYADRDEEHTRFSLVYDISSPKIQKIMRIVGNGLIVVSFSIALLPTYRFISFMSFKRADSLPLRMDYVYSPFLLMQVFVIVRYALRIYRDIRGIKNKEETAS